ncbi:MAG TPA: preprotein translocase subunit YajC [Rhodanobacteraceae bacterium]|nr:preprotein translocase subunit YajC [Rhodanobacteraceae bacterium]
MDFLIPVAHAADAAAPAGGAAGFGTMNIIFIVLMIAIFYFMLIRPQSKRAKEHKQMLAQLAKGDEVITNGGVAGRVDEIGEAFISVEIANNVKVKLQKHAISQVLPKGTLKAS